MAGESENDMDFVSQDEIDRLLDQADEPPSKEAASAGDGDGLAGTQAAEPASGDPLFEDSAPVPEKASDREEPASGESPDRVILEEVPEALPEKTGRAAYQWTLHKNFWITLAGVCVLGLSLNLLLWWHNHRRLEVVKPEIRSFPVVNAPEVAAPAMFRASPRSITLKGFLVPAPVERKDLTYITADVTLELTHPEAVSLIKAHASFYRNIIYDVIKRVLGSLDKSKISEISLKLEILKALNGSVPERSVRDVLVDTFVMF